MSLISRLGNSWLFAVPAGNTPASANASGTIHRNIFMSGLIRLTIRETCRKSGGP
jgi:hypothetical protein